MRAVRDLRDLVNVSRLSYVESDDEDNYTAPSMYSFNSSIDFEKSSLFTDRSLNKNKNKLMQPIYNLSDSSKLSNSPNISNSQNIPKYSAKTPVQSGSTNSLTSVSSLFDSNETRSSFFKDTSSLFERNTKPTVNNISSQSQISLNIKKPLPPLTKGVNNYSKCNQNDKGYEIQPLTDNKLTSFHGEKESSKEENSKEKNSSKTGNFDKMLTYIDASVVSEWLNRSNRSLRKMHRWHHDNKNLYEMIRPNSSKSNGDQYIKYESFIKFCNFWLGCSKTSKLDHKQRRQLLEMEYSIICDEVTQAFQIGMDTQEINLADIHRLLHAVFKEYPLQLLSFRGVYMLLDYIDTLSSNRLNEYKTLLSDVKCRTVNKQYAQWLLSIRSFALINMCWSIVKFYKKTCQNEIKYNETMDKEQTVLDELDGRISSLSLVRGHSDEKIKTRSDSTSSSLSSNSNDSNYFRPKSSKTNNFIQQRPDSTNSAEFIQISNQEKYDFYLKAVLKHDYPEVLHYLITTKKCDPHKVDDQGRTLMFLAVIHDLPKILNYLVKRWPTIDINRQCHSGNTALHAAVNQGNLILVELLLKSLTNDFENNTKESENNKKIPKQLDVNKTNEKCMNSTPLHLAVWNDFQEIAIRLVQSKSDPNLKMGGTSNAFDLAIDNSNQVLYELLNEYYNDIIIND